MFHRDHAAYFLIQSVLIFLVDPGLLEKLQSLEVVEIQLKLLGQHLLKIWVDLGWKRSEECACEADHASAIQQQLDKQNFAKSFTSCEIIEKLLHF